MNQDLKSQERVHLARTYVYVDFSTLNDVSLKDLPTAMTQLCNEWLVTVDEQIKKTKKPELFNDVQGRISIDYAGHDGGIEATIQVYGLETDKEYAQRQAELERETKLQAERVEKKKQKKLAAAAAEVLKQTAAREERRKLFEELQKEFGSDSPGM